MRLSIIEIPEQAANSAAIETKFAKKGELNNFSLSIQSMLHG